jgi:aryl-alcohol dehydrogenase-like predicted oxidoreductase
MSESCRLPRCSFGRTGLQVSRLALSARSMTVVGPPGLKLGAEEVERAFHEHGVTTFLVSPGMKDLSEGLRRLIDAGHRDELVLIGGAALPFGWNVRRAFDRTARALGTTTLDVFLLGSVMARRYLTGDTWAAMQRLKQEGRVRAVGFSSHNRRLAATLAREFHVDVLMIRYNAAHRGAETEVFAELGADRPAIISYTATRWGVLLRPLPDRGFPKAMTAGECYRFVLSHPAVDMALFAARTADELREDVAAVLEGALDRERLEEVRRFGDVVHGTVRGRARWAFR